MRPTAGGGAEAPPLNLDIGPSDEVTMKRTLTIIMVLGLLGGVLLTIMMNTYLEPLKRIPKLRDEIAERHRDLLAEGSTPGLERLQVEEPDGPRVGWVVRVRPKPEMWDDVKALHGHFCAIVVTVFESEHRGDRVDFVDVVALGEEEERRAHRRITLDEARRGRAGRDLLSGARGGGVRGEE